MSEEGAQQDDPLGSLLFCLAVPQIVVKLLSEFNLKLTTEQLGVLCEHFARHSYN